MSQLKGPALVVLAAGLGSRYGGFKQLDAIGADNESIMDLSIKDAIAAGFEKVVLVINKQISSQINRQVEVKYQKAVDISCVFQELNALPYGFSLPQSRENPWGTAHAILAASKVVKTPFAVINADDFYGSSAYPQMKEMLSIMPGDSNQYCMLGYLLVNTLSNHGGVSRGLCRMSGEYLSSIKEVKNIRKVDDEICGEYENETIILSPDSIVSMNFWGFTPRVFSMLEEQFGWFLQNNLADDKAEFFITEALDYSINKGLSRVKVLRTSERWYGVTFREDRDEVRKGIQEYMGSEKPERP